jgi:hypothetical protein
MNARPLRIGLEIFAGQRWGLSHGCSVWRNRRLVAHSADTQAQWNALATTSSTGFECRWENTDARQDEDKPRADATQSLMDETAR